MGRGNKRLPRAQDRSREGGLQVRLGYINASGMCSPVLKAMRIDPEVGGCYPFQSRPRHDA
jgi:hypothetical protein